MARVIALSAKESIVFAAKVVGILESKGFHICDLKDALACIDMITTELSMVEIQSAMEYLNSNPNNKELDA